MFKVNKCNDLVDVVLQKQPTLRKAEQTSRSMDPSHFLCDCVQTFGFERETVLECQVQGSDNRMLQVSENHPGHSSEGP